MDNVLKEIGETVAKAQANLPEGFEEKNSLNDFIAYINAYTGRAAQGVLRNEREDQSYRENMIKAAGLAVSAIVEFDRRNA